MELAVADMRIVDQLTPEFIEKKMELINGGVEMNGRRWSPSTGVLREEMERGRRERLGGGGSFWGRKKMAKPTYNPSRIIRKRRHGYRSRVAAGGQVLKSRRRKGRARLSA